MTQPASRDSLPRPESRSPSDAHHPGADRVSGHGRSFWWLSSLAIAAAGAIITAWSEQQFQRGVPVILGALGGFIIGAVEASLINKRFGSGTGRETPRLIFAGIGTVFSLALGVSAAFLPSIECAIAAGLAQRRSGSRWPALVTTAVAQIPSQLEASTHDGSSRRPP
jgi:drug/metabolite transporter (DMT)-like permease